MGRRECVMLAGAQSGRTGPAARDVIYVIYRWIFHQVIVVARKPFYSAVPKNHEQSRNILRNCKTFFRALNRVGAATLTITIALWMFATAVVMAALIHAIAREPLGTETVHRGGP